MAVLCEMFVEVVKMCLAQATMEYVEECCYGQHLEVQVMKSGGVKLVVLVVIGMPVTIERMEECCYGQHLEDQVMESGGVKLVVLVVIGMPVTMDRV
ncbi:hypothetical protein Leryth_001042 [Lithospermum erythrorhizon]|nr:hypothetical protein Leryth_001042 [Lithospermum erythrorhizon]